MPSDSRIVAGVTNQILIVQPGEDLDYNYYAIIENLAPAIGMSSKYDVAEDCEIRTIQDSPDNWNPEKLKAQAMKVWPDEATKPSLFFDSFRGDGTILGSIWLLFIREPKLETTSSEYRYPEFTFPWETQLSILIHASFDRPFTEAECASFEEIIMSADLTGTTGYEIRVYTEEANVNIDPIQVQFYDANELHAFMEKIDDWAAETQGTINRSPHKCTSCHHYTRSEYEECQVCGHVKSF